MWPMDRVIPVRRPRSVGSWYQWFAWWLQRLLMMMSCPPMGAGSDGRDLVMGLGVRDCRVGGVRGWSLRWFGLHVWFAACLGGQGSPCGWLQRGR